MILRLVLYAAGALIWTIGFQLLARRLRRTLLEDDAG